MKTYTLEELKNELIGIKGSAERVKYEQELALNCLKEVEFWKQLKLELGNREYFCHSSELFERWWWSKDFREKIIQSAAEFLKNNEKYKEVYSNVAVLFSNLEELNHNIIREEFCDYMIDKLKNSGNGRN
jgi:hypothetical protein